MATVPLAAFPVGLPTPTVAILVAAAVGVASVSVLACPSGRDASLRRQKRRGRRGRGGWAWWWAVPVMFLTTGHGAAVGDDRPVRGRRRGRSRARGAAARRPVRPATVAEPRARPCPDPARADRRRHARGGHDPGGGRGLGHARHASRRSGSGRNRHAGGRGRDRDVRGAPVALRPPPARTTSPCSSSWG